MSQNEVFENLKGYIESEIEAYESYGKPVGASLSSLIDRCYGAMIFSNYLVEDSQWWGTTIGAWWDEKMRPRLYSL